MDFKQAVFAAVQQVPAGRVVTYKQVAAYIGNPKSARAVGNALNTNRDTTLVPCHRVVRASGQVGGYAFGAGNKERRLRDEGVAIQGGFVVVLSTVQHVF